MRRALDLAARGLGRVSPNPMVGAVLVRSGRAVGEGFHARFGGAHAESAALTCAGSHARGATLYVTLEPCCHDGKTPPCTEAIAAAGVRRVVIAAQDPNPEISGKGIAKLRAVGVRVQVGCLEREAQRLNGAYETWRRESRPFVTLKWAETEDGRLAGPRGRRIMISGRAALREAHRLRAASDAVLVGVRTVLSDDPRLTVRLAPCERDPVRIVLDPRARTPLSSRLVKTARRVPVWIIAAPSAAPARLAALSNAGCEVIVLPARGGKTVLPALATLLARRHIQSLLVEGGGRVLASFARVKLVDRVVCWIAPRRLGGGLACPLPPPGTPGASPLVYSRIRMRHEGRDIRVEAETVPTLRKTAPPNAPRNRLLAL